LAGAGAPAVGEPRRARRLRRRELVESSSVGAPRSFGLQVTRTRTPGQVQRELANTRIETKATKDPSPTVELDSDYVAAKTPLLHPAVETRRIQLP
jgi:hypothetical protein